MSHIITKCHEFGHFLHYGGIFVGGILVRRDIGQEGFWHWRDFLGGILVGGKKEYFFDVSVIFVTSDYRTQGYPIQK